MTTKDKTKHDETLRVFPAGGSSFGPKNLSIGQPGKSKIMDKALRQKSATKREP